LKIITLGNKKDMKNILLIALLGLMLVSCNGQMEKRADRNMESPEVKDEYGVEYSIITIEGCEFYMALGDGQSGLTKVDCDCIPDKSKR
jgi:hypothetical protein